MRTNKFLIGGLRGVHISSVVFEAIRTISSLVFFIRKNIERKKAIKRKTNDFQLLRRFCACEKLLPLLFFVRLFLFC